jgi:lipopolysaccharide export system permease protein
MMRRLDRYVLAEVLGPLTLGFLVYTFLLLMQFLFRSADMIIRRGVPADQVGQLLVLTIPNIVVLTIPMALLFGILVAVGRLSADSELIAMRSTGVSLFSLYRPILALSLLLTLINAFLMIYALPRGNHALQQLRIDILTSSVTKQVEPRVFYEDWEGLVLYVFEAPPESAYWQGVFVAEDLPSDENQITIAERGDVRLDEAGDRLVLHLENALIHKVDFRHPEKYTTTMFKSLDRVLVDQYTSQQRIKVSSSKGIRELTMPELRAQLQNPDLSDALRNLTKVEIHKKFSIPAACLVFGLLALPLGYNTARGGRSSGFALSIAVIMVYYILLNNGEETARVGRMEPWLAMWLPNILLAGLGLFLMARRNQDKSLLLGRLDRWLRQRIWIRSRPGKRQAPSRAVAAGPATAASPRRAHFVLRLPRFRIRFPNLLDRYVAQLFWAVFGLVMLSGISIYMIADLTERVDDIFNNDVSRDVVIDYYKYLSASTDWLFRRSPRPSSWLCSVVSCRRGFCLPPTSAWRRLRTRSRAAPPPVLTGAPTASGSSDRAATFTTTCAMTRTRRPSIGYRSSSSTMQPTWLAGCFRAGRSIWATPGSSNWAGCDRSMRRRCSSTVPSTSPSSTTIPRLLTTSNPSTSCRMP